MKKRKKRKREKKNTTEFNLRRKRRKKELKEERKKVKGAKIKHELLFLFVFFSSTKCPVQSETSSSFISILM